MRTSAGILLYRWNPDPEVLLVHPGGPFWQGKEEGAWSIPKGEFTEGEDALLTAKREFKEETGFEAAGTFLPLTPVKQKGGKMVWAWALEGNINAAAIVSNTFKAEWPYRSGRWQEFPEVDKAEWFSIGVAKIKINPAQAAFIDELCLLLRHKME